jgi:prepilin-type N-terminal cleavage/methylation domain-containing protein
LNDFMKRNQSRNPGAFTLIELLIVISIIAILAAMVIPITGVVKQRRTRAAIRAEVEKVASAIDAYKAKHGHYPPDNPCNVNVNPLYFELMGVRAESDGFVTLDGGASIKNTEFPTVFGNANGKPCVGGFVNASRGVNSDDNVAATAYLKDVKVGQYAKITDGVSAASTVRVLTSSQPWPLELPPLIDGQPGVNPIRYNSSNPTHNPKSFDLWVDVVVGGRTNRISNWQDSHEFVATPNP